MFEKITDINYKNGKINIITNFYNIYCYYKCCDNLDEKYKNIYDYYSIVKYTKLKNKYCDYWNGDSLVSSGIPYGVIVFNLDYDEKCNPYNASYTSAKYNLSLNNWKNTQTLQLKIKDKETDEQIKKILRDCYDNKIIIDFGKDYILVIEDIPLYSYFSLIDEKKHNNNYQVNYYYYEDEYVNKYINKYKMRDNFDDLNELLSCIKDKDDKQKQKHKQKLKCKKTILNEITKTLNETDLSKAPIYKKYLIEKSQSLKQSLKQNN
jgi:hypothetical protein